MFLAPMPNRRKRYMIHRSLLFHLTVVIPAFFVCCLATAPALAAPVTVPTSLAGDSIVLPTGFNDPIEPFNRAMWGFNKGFMTSVVRPASKVYRRVVVKPVRTGIGNMGRNLTFPD